MTHRWLTLGVVMAFGLSSGCGCQSRAIDGGDEGALPATGPSTAGGTAGGASGPAAAGPNINATQDTGDGPAIPTGDQAVDPTPKSYIAAIEALAPPLEKETLTTLAAELDAKLAANTKDPVAWCARASISARQALHAVTRAKPDLDLSEFDKAIEQASKHAGDGQWKYLVSHQLASKARLEGKAQVAVDHLKEAIRLQPAFVLGHVEYLQMMMVARKLEEAEPKLHTLVKRWPGEWQGWFTLARCQIALKKLPPAKASLQEAIKLRPDMLVLQESMLRIESLIYRERKDEEAEAVVRTRFETILAVAKKHFKKAESYEQYKRSVDAMGEQFEVSRSALLVIDFDELPADRRTYEQILGKLNNPNDRRRNVRGLSVGIPGNPKSQARVCFLIDVVRKDESDPVRVDALRGLHQNLAGRAPRPWKESERTAIAAECEDELAVLMTNLDPAKDRTVLLRLYETMGKLPVSSLSCGPELIGPLAQRVEKLVPVLKRILALESKARKERTDEEKSELKTLLKQLTPLVEELEVIDAALKGIRGLGAFASPRWDVPADIKRWRDAWKQWADEIAAMRTEKGWTRAQRCK
jgi:tetratricopeptide (TPR) repeat protein